MNCPVDGSELMSSARAGVEINRCPTCRGVWLDAGELESIVKHAAAEPKASPEGEYDEDGYHPTSSPKRRGFLRELFDL